MPVRKFRSLTDMALPVECEPLSEDHLRRVAGLWHRAFLLGRRIYPRGVFKYRSIEEAQRGRARMIEENIARLKRNR